MSAKFVRGLAVGAAAAAVAVIYGPAIAKAARPAVRNGMKSAFVAYMRGREVIAEVLELAEDAYAEAASDLREEAEQAAREGQTGTTADATIIDSKDEFEARPKRARS